MRDFLIGDDYFISMCMATMGYEESLVRLGKRMYEQQEVYRDVLDKEGKIYKQLKSIADAGRRHFKDEKDISRERGDIHRKRIPNYLQGNLQVYELADFMLENRDKFKLRGSRYLSEKESWEKCYQSTVVRSGTIGHLKEQSIELREFEDFSKVLAKMTTLEISIEDLNFKRVEEHNSYIKENKFKYSKRSRNLCRLGFDMVVIGGLKVFLTDERCYILTENHYTRFVDYMRSIRNSTLVGMDVSIECEVSEISKVIHKMCILAAREDANAVGEAMKAARQISFLSLERSDILGKSSELYKGTLSDDRLRRANSMISTISAFSVSKVIRTNLLGFYTSLPHPDAPLDDMFRSIEGVHEPNRTDPSFEKRLDGVLRRTLFMSMRKSGHDVRTNCIEPESKELSDRTNDITQSIAAAGRFSTSAWAGTEFQEVRSIPKLSDIDVPVASKASSAGILMTTSEEQEAKAYYSGYGDSITSKLFKPTSVNDAAEAIRGRSRMNIDKCLKRFDRIITLHERFESRYKDKEIDDIPFEDLRDFIKSHPMAQYVVGTEGKFGEVHKVVTRLFYMAEQELKALTQRVERIARQVSREQMGVSIVKSYMGRRSDLDRCIRSMTGRNEEMRSIAVSFDMSEFSKKFPMSLVRKYGKILGEITGESNLSRIDLFFRASKVMYSNRGYYNDLRGVRGGFEGFLNFIWSSIHAAIMEVALETTGVKGDLLTFSDDGLLLFYPRSDVPDIELEGLIEKIREAYGKLGLVFHLGKTLVSDHMWEYLGDVCYDNRLIPMWFKEMVKIGRINPTRGFTPLYDKIKVVDAQAGAMVVSSGNPITSYLLKRYTCDRILRKWCPETSFLLREVLLILPSGCGGLRICSPYEDTNVTNLSNDMEIYSDIVLLEKYGKGIYSKITSAILSKMPYFKESKGNYRRAISNMSFFKTSLPDTSGDSALSKLLESVRIRTGYKMPSDPLDGLVAEEIYEILRTGRNIDLDSIQLLINAIPGMSEYRAHKGVMKGSGALKLSRRKDLRLAQNTDTRNVKSCISFWWNVLSKEAPASRTDFLSECMSRNYPSLSVIKPRPPPRLVLVKTDQRSKACIEVKISSYNEKNIYDSPYKEPILHTSMDKSTLMWNAETKGSNETRDIRKMLKAVHAIISHSPQSENLIRSITDIFGIRPPSTLAGRVRGAHRDRKGMRRSVEARLIIPRYHMSKIEYRNMGRLSFFLSQQRRKDENTYGICAESLAYFYHARENKLGEQQPPTDCKYYFEIDQSMFIKCFTPDEMHDTNMTPILPDESTFGKRLETEYISYASEQEKQISQAEMLTVQENVRDGLDDETSTLMIGGMIKVVENYLVSMKSMSSGTILTGSDLPDLAHLRTYILRRAIVSASIKLYEPLLRQRLSICISSNREAMNLGSVLNEPLFIDLLNDMTEMYNLLPAEVRLRTPEIGLDDYNHKPRVYLDIISAYLFDSSLLSSKKMVIFFPKSFLSHEVSNDHRVAYRQMLRETIVSLHSAFRQRGWSAVSLKRDFPILINSPIDETMDCLKVLYPMIRSSKHRSTPYNSKSAIIMLKKFYMLVFLMYKEVGRLFLDGWNRYEIRREHYVNGFKDWVPSKSEKKEILNIVNQPGEDMIDNVNRKFGRPVVARAAYYAMQFQMRSKHLEKIISKTGPINREIVNIQSAFKETIMTAAYNKISAYGYGMSNLVRNEFVNMAPNLDIVAGLETNIDRATGVDVMDYRVLNEVGDLIINHAEIIKHKTGYLGFKSDGDPRSGISSRIADHFQLEDYPNVPTLSSSIGSNEFTAIDLECSNIGKAMTTYMHLQKGGNSSLSIVKFEQSKVPGQFYIGESDEESKSDSDISDESSRPGVYSVDRSNVLVEGIPMRELINRGYRWGDIEEDTETDTVYIDEDDSESGKDLADEQEDDNRLRQMNDGDEVYRVIGVSGNKNIKVDSESNPAVFSTLTETLHELIDNVTIHDSLYETSTIISSLSTNPNRTVTTHNAPYSVSRQSDLFTPGRQVNEKSVLLQNAVEMATDSNEGGILLGAYIMFHCWIKQASTTSRVIECAEEVIALFRNETTRVGLLSDVSMITRWLRSSDIKAGMDLNHLQKVNVRRRLNKMLKVQGVNIDVLPTTLMFRDFKTLRSLIIASGDDYLSRYKDLAYYSPYGEVVLEMVDVGDEDSELFE